MEIHYSQQPKNLLESLKKRMGIGNPEINKGEAFEEGKQIIPDCIKPSEGEIPVKQYDVATLRNRIMGIPYAKAIGRIQVTNKRVIFRAPGTCLAGKTILQHDFAIDEIAGVEAHYEYTYNLWYFLWGIIIACIGVAPISLLLTHIGVNAWSIILALLFGIAGCIPFFLLKKKWLLKLLCLGCSLSSLSIFGIACLQNGNGWGGFLEFLGIIPVIFTWITLFIYSIRPNLVLSIKTKAANPAINIRRKQSGLFGVMKDDNTGYMEILPANDALKTIKEISALINDIQKLGDLGLEKWMRL